MYNPLKSFKVLPDANMDFDLDSTLLHFQIITTITIIIIIIINYFYYNSHTTQLMTVAGVSACYVIIMVVSSDKMVKFRFVPPDSNLYPITLGLLDFPDYF